MDVDAVAKTLFYNTELLTSEKFLVTIDSSMNVCFLNHPRSFVAERTDMLPPEYADFKIVNQYGVARLGECRPQLRRHASAKETSGRVKRVGHVCVVID